MKTLLLITAHLLLLSSCAFVFKEPAMASSFSGLKFTSSTKEAKEVCSKAGLKVVSEETKKDTTFDNRNTTIVFAGAIDKSDYPVKFVQTGCLFLNDSLFMVYMTSGQNWYRDEREEHDARAVALSQLTAMKQYLEYKFGRQPDEVPVIPLYFRWHEGQFQIMVNMQMVPAYTKSSELYPGYHCICYSILYTGMFIK